MVAKSHFWRVFEVKCIDFVQTNRSPIWELSEYLYSIFLFVYYTIVKPLMTKRISCHMRENEEGTMNEEGNCCLSVFGWPLPWQSEVKCSRSSICSDGGEARRSALLVSLCFASWAVCCDVQRNCMRVSREKMLYGGNSRCSSPGFHQGNTPPISRRHTTQHRDHCVPTKLSLFPFW